MKMIAEKVRVVGRNTQTWKDGDVSYRLQLSNGEGGTCVANCDESVYSKVVPLDVIYDMEINCDTNGYKNYVDVLAVFEV